MPICLNEVRPRRPEQCVGAGGRARAHTPGVSMKSGLEGRNNPCYDQHPIAETKVSMKSGLEGRNNEYGAYSITNIEKSQ